MSGGSKWKSKQASDEPVAIRKKTKALKLEMVSSVIDRVKLTKASKPTKTSKPADDEEDEEDNDEQLSPRGMRGRGWKIWD